jgi:uncharacterized protein (DUF2237 family)
MTVFLTSGRNVLGGALQACSYDPVAGYFRDGCCRTGEGDQGLHVVCARMTDEFLAFSADQGNDLSTPRPELRFRGLKPGQRWCLCASRWLEAWKAGVAPPVILECTHEKALEVIPLDILRAFAFQPPVRPGGAA